MRRRLAATAAASAIGLGVTGSAWAAYPSIITFENDTDAYTPPSRNVLDDPNLDGSPPLFPSPPIGNSARDIRTGYAAVVEELPSNHFATVPTAAAGANLGIVNFEGGTGPHGFPMPGLAFPAGNLQWSFQMDVYTDPALPFRDNGQPTFWWTNSIENAAGNYLTEQGFQVYVNNNNTWRFDGGNVATLANVPVGQWVTMEVLFDLNDPSGIIYGVEKLWSKDRTTLYGENRNIAFQTPPATSAFGPGYSWMPYPNPLGVDALFIDDWGIGPAIVGVTPPSTDRFWDVNGTTPGAGSVSPSGSWDGAAANFNTDAAGGAGTMSAVTTALDTVTFSAGSDATSGYTVTVGGSSQAAAQVKVEDGNVTFNSGAIATSAFDVASGASAVVNSQVIGGTSGGFTKSGGGTLTLNSPNYDGDTNVTGGTLVSAGGFKAEGALNIADGAKAIVPEAGPSTYDPGNNQFPSGSDANGSLVTAVDIQGSGQLDLGNSDMVIDYTISSPLTDVRDLIASGYNFGSHDGPGIISSTAANTDPFTFALGYGENADLPLPYGTEFGGGMFSGQDPDATSVLIKFTWIGDVTLDGIFDFQDLSIFNGNYDAGATTGRLWTEGDLNYDGTIDFQDLSLFNGTYDPSKPSLPEPTGFALLAAFAAGITGRRRRA